MNGCSLGEIWGHRALLIAFLGEVEKNDGNLLIIGGPSGQLGDNLGLFKEIWSQIWVSLVMWGSLWVSGGSVGAQLGKARLSVYSYIYLVSSALPNIWIFPAEIMVTMTFHHCYLLQDPVTFKTENSRHFCKKNI